jgi:hypothetical protein
MAMLQSCWYAVYEEVLVSRVVASIGIAFLLVVRV